MKYEEVLASVREAVSDLRSRGITVKALDDALRQLEGHARNLAAVEHSLEAIREEVLAPVVCELEQNKRAGKFSILGLYVGLASMVLSIVVTLAPWLSGRLAQPGTMSSAQAGDNSSSSEIARLTQQVDRLVIQLSGIPDSYAPKDNEVEALQFEKTALLRSDSGEIGVEVTGVEELSASDKALPVVGIEFHLDNRRIGEAAVRSLFRVERLVSETYARSSDARFRAPRGQLWLAEGDVLVYRNDTRWKAVRVFRRRSVVLPVADSKDGVLLRRVSTP